MIEITNLQSLRTISVLKQNSSSNKIRNMSSPLRPPSHLKTALLLIDIQSGITPSTTYFGQTRSTPSFETNIPTLLSKTRAYNTTHAANPDRQVSIIHVNHDSIHPVSPLYPGKETNKPMAYAMPIEGEVMVRKSVNSAFVNTDLEGIIRREGIKQLVVCGLTSGHCVSTSVRAARDLDVIGDRDAGVDGDATGERKEKGVIAILADCSAAFEAGGFDAETVHGVNMESLRGEFAEVVHLKEWLYILGMNRDD